MLERGFKFMPKRTRRYENGLIEALKNPKEAAAYLNVHLEEDSEDSEELFLLALRDVAHAHGIGTIAERSDLGRESLYKTLSSEGNPKFHTLKSILKSMGLKLSVEEEEKKAS
jgi:probable addiction module antidote protein